jgi:hypothetical protein
MLLCDVEISGMLRKPLNVARGRKRCSVIGRHFIRLSSRPASLKEQVTAIFIVWLAS